MPFEKINGLDEVRAHYATSSQASNFYSFFIYGEGGAGKSRSALTIPGPGHVISFDPGGTKVLKDHIDSGRITVDTRFEDPKYKGNAKDCFHAFMDEYNRLTDKGVFKQLGDAGGWFMVDSGTFLLEALLKSCTRGEVPTLPEYNKMGILAIEMIGILARTPCNLILTGHVELYKDDERGKIHAGILVSGKKLKVKLPLLFDEVYYVEGKEENSGSVTYTYQTANNGFYQARTRMGREGLFKLREPAHIGELMLKAHVIDKITLEKGGCVKLKRETGK